MSSLSAILTAANPIVVVSMSCVFVAFGVIGCILNIFLFCRKRFRKISCCAYFLVAAAAMFVQLMLISVVNIYSFNNTDPHTYLLALCKIRFYLTQVTSMIYRWALIAASFDRYVMSSHSPRLRSLANVKIAHRVTVAIVLIWFILPTTVLIFYDIRSRVCAIFDSIGSLYTTIFTFINSIVLPPTLMLIFTLLIQRNMAQKRLRRQILSNPQQTTNDHDHLQKKRDQQSLRMLFAQIFAFVVATTPWMAQSIYNLFSASIPDKSADRIAIERFSIAITGNCVFIFPTISFYAYTLTSNMFRQELVLMLQSVFCNKCTIYNNHHNNNRIQPITTSNVEPRTMVKEGPETAVNIHQNNLE